MGKVGGERLWLKSPRDIGGWGDGGVQWKSEKESSQESQESELEAECERKSIHD